MNIELNITLHPFNETVIDTLLTNSPKFANGFKPENLNLNQKKQIYNQIKNFNSEKSNRTYNLFFEVEVSKLN